MKTRENSIFQFSLSHPIATALLVVTFFAAIISFDQSLYGHTETTNTEIQGKINSLNTNYVAWSSSNVEIISRLRDSQAEPEIAQGYAYFSGFKAASKNIIRYIHVQVKLFKRITNL